MTGAGLVSRLGIFARTFRRNTPAEVADAVIGAGYALAHWNFAAIGRSTLAADVEDDQFTAVHTAFDSAGLGIPSVSGTSSLVCPAGPTRAASSSDRSGRFRERRCPGAC
jgi:hypothetical protein